MSKKLRIFFTVSILLNLLLLGVVFGHAGKSLLGCKASRHLNLHEMVTVLPEQKQQELSPIVEQSDHDIKQLREQLSEEHREAAHLLEAEPFDKTAYQSQIDAIQKLRLQIGQNMADALARIAAQCTQEERRKLADKLIERQNQLNKE